MTDRTCSRCLKTLANRRRVEWRVPRKPGEAWRRHVRYYCERCLVIVESEKTHEPEPSR